MRKLKIRVDGEEYMVEVEEVDGDSSQSRKKAPKTTRTKRKTMPKAKQKTKEKNPAASGDIKAPMPGKILEVKTAEGSEVKTGDILLVLEAMKMENDITAPNTGVVKEIKVNEGENVEADDILVKME